MNGLISNSRGRNFFTGAEGDNEVAFFKEKLDAAPIKTVTGEVVDMMCYVDHNAMGDKHASCAAKCIKGGGPVGITSEGKTYLVVGDHKPMNDQLAEYAGKTVTLKGKLASNGGIPMLENAEIVKK